MQSGFEPRVLICSECKEEFVFTAAAQEYFAERGYTEDPKRCKSCHMKYKKLQRSQQNHSSFSPLDAKY
ncbi:MAG TPA: zinc-ribbon domain containing protein [Acidobacteriota bacterium]|nr:zinc-ribbon domain containing protein [Acidobacteriota bacterium]